jgi:UPF0042 nucleotide-binding protein
MKTAKVVLITGMSGSGKSVALHALEDAGFFCVDNLPPELLPEFVRLEGGRRTQRIAVAVDVRTGRSLPVLLPLMQALEAEGVRVRSIFLDSATPALVRRYAESRRPHPLARGGTDGTTTQALEEAIAQERKLLSDLREASTILDTSLLRPAQLRTWVRDLVGAGTGTLTLVFESFAYKRGVPLDADFVFDLRVLPNPFYVRELRPLNGRDEAVRRHLDAQPEAAELLAQISAFLERWIPGFESDQRSHLIVALGCTGGQHRSVYAAEQLAARFSAGRPTLVRHRELDHPE